LFKSASQISCGTLKMLAEWVLILLK